MPELSAFRFMVEIDGVTAATFKEATGFESETEVIEYKECTADGRLITRKVPGTPKWADITLKRHVESTSALWEWRKQVTDGDIEGARRNGSFILYNSQHEEVKRWNFQNGWPSKWKGPDGNAGEDQVAVEELTVVVEGLELA